jgi:hypothetical protein
MAGYPVVDLLVALLKFLVWFFLLFGLYMLPTIIGQFRAVPNLTSIGVINVLLGWTLVGWVVALAMAVRDIPDAEQAVASPHDVGTVENLTQLAELHERGLLTDEEFAAAKRRLLTTE